MQRKTAGVILVLAGLVLVVEPFADKLFSRTQKFEAMTADFRPVMRPETIATFRQDLQTLSALPAALQSSLIPALAQQAHVTPAQLQQLLASNYPAITNGVQAIGPLSAQLTRTLDTMQSQLSDFEKTDAIPTKTRSTEGIPWALLLTGIVALIAGFAVFSPGRIAPAVAVVLGALLIGVPLVTSMPTKTPAADRLNASNRALITTANAEALNTAVTTLTALGTEFQTKLIPDLAARFQIPPAQLVANPVVASLATALPAGLQRIQTAATLIDSNVARYEAVRPVSFVRVMWVSIGSGMAALLAGILGLAYAQGAAEVREHRIRRALTRRSKEAAA
jgi:hypothetical protein